VVKTGSTDGNGGVAQLVQRLMASDQKVAKSFRRLMRYSVSRVLKKDA